MKIERIGHNKLKITVSSADLLSHGISLDSFSPDSPRVQDFFYTIMKHAESELDFSIEEGRVLIEAMPLSNESIIIFMTKPEGSAPAAVLPRRVRYKVKTQKCMPQKAICYQFESFDDLCALCHEWRYTGEKSNLYNLRGTYYMTVTFPQKNPDERFARSKLLEFAKPDDTVSVPYLEEYAAKICTDDAIASILRYF